MIRKTLFGVAVLTAALVTVVAGLPAGLAQESDATPEDEPALVSAEVELTLGQRYEGSAWDVEAQNVFVAAANDRIAWSEVRISVALRNTSPDPLAYSSTAFFDGEGYPRLTLVDAFDVTRKYEVLRPSLDAIPNSNVTEIPPGLTGRWTVGFQVPTVNVAFLRLQLSDPLSGLLAEWDLTTSSEPEAWEPPPLENVEVGEVFAWGDDGLAVMPVQYGTLVCGDPDNRYITQIFALQMDVTNANFTNDVPWPGSRLPQTAAVAQWPDGSSAQMSYETFGGPQEVLRKFASDLVFIPPTDGEFFARGMLFGVTKDSRVGDVDDPPQGVQLNQPDGTSFWLPLDGPGELPVNPRFCDLGLFEGPLVLSFTPGEEFDVGSAAPRVVTDAVLDAATSEAMVQAVIVVGEAAQQLDDLTELTAADLNALWPPITFVDGLQVGAVVDDDVLITASAVIGVEPTSPTQVLLMTQSPTGRYYCALFDEDPPAVLANGEDFDSVLNACLPPDLTAEEQAADETTTTTTTTTSSTTTTTLAP